MNFEASDTIVGEISPMPLSPKKYFAAKEDSSPSSSEVYEGPPPLHKSGGLKTR